MQTFSQAIKNVETPPCEVHKCRHYNECATELKACTAFKQYVAYGRNFKHADKNELSKRMIPSKAIYDDIYEQD